MNREGETERESERERVFEERVSVRKVLLVLANVDQISLQLQVHIKNSNIKY